MKYKFKLFLLSLAPLSIRRRVMMNRYVHQIDNTGEPELLELKNFIEPGAVVIDVGCNLGVYTYELSRLGAIVHAFEPNPALAKFVSGLHLPNVQMRNVALSRENGSAELNIPLNQVGSHGWASLREDKHLGELEKIPVKTKTLDSYAFERLDFIKIDVEGFEEEVLQGGMETIASKRPILLIEIENRHNEDGVARITRSLDEHNYNCWYLRSGQWRALDLADVAVLQDPECLAKEQASHVSHRESEYVNNFLFVPAENSIVSSVNGIS